ncbi:MAG: sugar ABC transporter ATP-binding protein, partial [Bacilli bacterium]
REAIEYLKILNVDLNPNTELSELSVSKQQMVEIVKALSTNAKVIIMDEPTSTLTSKEIDELFKIINQLKQAGHCIIYISHRLEELEAICDRVVILRDGAFIGDYNFNDIDIDTIISKMVGRKIDNKYPRTISTVKEEILRVENLNVNHLLSDISFNVNAGEIVGISGLMGAGRSELTNALFGLEKISSGNIYLNNKKILVNKPIDAINNGILLVPEDRKKDGLCINLSVKENIALANLDYICKQKIFINKKIENQIVQEAITKLQIKVANANVDAITLSGGNQQKVVIGKWLLRKCNIIIFDEPTRGVDVKAKVEIYNLMNRLKDEGIGVIFVSSEMPEIIGMADRVLVMCDGCITANLSKDLINQDTIMKYATTFKTKA